jgi:hypothetical protein
MVRRTITFLALLMTGLNMGGAFAHVLELPVKMRLDGPAYLQTQGIYRGFGPVGAILEPGSVLAAAITAALSRKTPAYTSHRIGFAFLAAALASWLALVAPMNARFARWTAETIPPDWKQTRNQWEYAHAARFFLQFVGFGALLAGALLRRPNGGG